MGSSLFHSTRVDQGADESGQYLQEATTNRLVVLQDRCYAMLLETAAARGYEAVFRDGTWGTWTMEMFCESLLLLTYRYQPANNHFVDAKQGT